MPDLVTANFYSADLSIVVGVGDGAFAATQTYHVGQQPISVAVADLDQDGLPDLVAVNSRSGDVSVLLGGGNGILGPEQRYGVGPGPSSVAVADLNNDGEPDLVTANNTTDDVSILLGLSRREANSGMAASTTRQRVVRMRNSASATVASYSTGGRGIALPQPSPGGRGRLMDSLSVWERAGIGGRARTSSTGTGPLCAANVRR